MNKKRLAMLTGGGDCPGLNPVIRAVTRSGIQSGYEIIGVRNGWKGMIEKDFIVLDRGSVAGILHRGGTILGTSRTNPRKIDGASDRIFQNFKELNLDVLIAIGGDDTLGVAYDLYQRGLAMIGVPKTIDNDLSGTDCTFGYDTAVNIAMEAIDRLHSTAESHHRVLVVELMGRHTGWITIGAGLSGGADYVLIPEYPVSMDEVAETIKKRHATGRTFSIVAVAEGFKVEGVDIIQTKELDAFGHPRLGGVGEIVARELEKRTNFETRSVVLGHVQRGGAPTAYDRILSTRYGLKAVELARTGQFGKMVSLRGTEIIAVDLQAVTKSKVVPSELYEGAKIFFG
ncbi:MAG: ATP-dependent 6-phosphofructokinase [Verrucomicrobia bacterium]|nr:ATP-dependent 6-phosphofructokinase [Verrucomicrobiota bacterium]